MQSNPATIADVRAVLQAFQDGYTHRDPAAVEAFMQLFVQDEDLEVIGTNASSETRVEWCFGPQKARELVENDWRYWGDLRIDVPGARIHALGEVAWLAADAAVSMHFDTQAEYADFLEFIQEIIKEKDWSAEEKVLYIQRGSTNTVYELRRGEDFTWPLRFTAVLVCREGRWLFHQMQFSFPTTMFPDERIVK